MIKQFIIAATSISCILSIASICDAKIAKANKSINLEQSCQKPVYSNAQYTQMAKDYPNLDKDLKDICQLINNHYTSINKGISAYAETNRRSVYRFVGIAEVKDIQLLGYVQEKSNAASVSADADIKLIERSYSWNNNSLYLAEAKDVKYHFYFFKMNGKWMIKSYSPVIKSDR